jgi:two-component system, sensor histidine kinase LadS
MLHRLTVSLLACCLWLAAMAPGPALAAPQLAIERDAFDRDMKGLDLRGHLEYAIVPLSAVDPDQVWQLDASNFRPMQPGQRLEIPHGSMLLARIELRLQQVRDPDYLQFPSSRLDRVHLWSRAAGAAWQQGEAGDRVALSHWPFAGPFPSFELPDGNERLQLVMEIEHRGKLNLPIEWLPDHVFRAGRLTHAFTFGSIAGLAAALALVCALATVLFRRVEFAALCGYTLLTGISLSASNGYAAVYLWPQWTAWNDPSKVFFSMVLVSVLLPLVARVLRLDVHRPSWWIASRRWAVAGFVYAVLQVLVLPPEWRTPANLVYVLATLGFAFFLAFHGVLRGDAMSRLTLLAIVVIAAGTALGYADLFDLVNELGLHVANAVCRLGFVVLMLCVAVQRHRFGRDVLSRLMAGANRDALTGLSNRTGLQQELARATLMTDAAVTRQAGVLLCQLQNMDAMRANFGDEVCDRMVVRFTQVLAGSIQGHAALLGRLGYGRFAAVILGSMDRDRLQATATRVLSRMLAQTDLPDAVREMKLHIGMMLVPLSDLRLETIEANISPPASRSGESRPIRWVGQPGDRVSVK